MAGILDGKVALITGAGSGIGRATSRIFAREGAQLVLVDVVAEAAQETLEAVRQAGAKAFCLKADVSKSDEVEAAVARTVSEFGRLDCAFNNAGIEGEPALTHKCSEANWNRVTRDQPNRRLALSEGRNRPDAQTRSWRGDRKYLITGGHCRRHRRPSLCRR